VCKGGLCGSDLNRVGDGAAGSGAGLSAWFSVFYYQMQQWSGRWDILAFEQAVRINA
jgi:hypothetical protein